MLECGGGGRDRIGGRRREGHNIWRHGGGLVTSGELWRQREAADDVEGLLRLLHGGDDGVLRPDLGHVLLGVLGVPELPVVNGQHVPVHLGPPVERLDALGALVVERPLVAVLVQLEGAHRLEALRTREASEADRVEHALVKDVLEGRGRARDDRLGRRHICRLLHEAGHVHGNRRRADADVLNGNRRDRILHVIVVLLFVVFLVVFLLLLLL